MNDLIQNQKQNGIQYKNWTIVDIEIAKIEFNKKAYLKVICNCGSEQLRSFFHVLNTLGWCNKCGVEPETYTKKYRFLKPEIGLKVHTLIFIDKIEREKKLPFWILRCELCNNELKIIHTNNPRPCTKCAGLIGKKINDLTMLSLAPNESGISTKQKIIARCSCGTVDQYPLATFRLGLRTKCRACLKPKLGFYNLNKQNKLRISELEEQLKIISEKLKVYEGK